MTQLHDVIDEFERLVGGMAMLGERPPRSVDEAVAIGERLTVVLVSAYLSANGTPAAGARCGRIPGKPAIWPQTPHRVKPCRVTFRGAGRQAGALGRPRAGDQPRFSAELS